MDYFKNINFIFYDKITQRDSILDQIGFSNSD